jgi:hypothetical protein
MTMASQHEAPLAGQAAKSKGLARVELQVPEGDVALAEKFAEGLRSGRGAELREAVDDALSQPRAGSALELFQSIALPDDLAEELNEILNEPRSLDVLREIEW